MTYRPYVSYRRVRSARMRLDPTLYIPRRDGLLPTVRQRGCQRCGFNLHLGAYALCDRHSRMYHFLVSVMAAEDAAELVRQDAAEMNLAHVGRRPRRR